MNDPRENAQYTLVVMINIGLTVMGKDPKIFALRIPQEKVEDGIKSAKTPRRSLSVISMETKCALGRGLKNPEIRGI